MTARAFVLLVWVCLIATAAVAGEERRTEIKIAVDGDAGDHKVLRFDSADSDLDIDNMAVGESQVITDSDGNEVTVLRTEDGLEIDVEGEKIEIGGLHDDHEFAMLHGTHDVDDIIVEKHKQVRVIKSHDTNGVTIITGDEIDADTRAALEKVLRDAGKDGEIVFIDGSELGGGEQVHGKREVRVIKKEIDVTN
ncbi:MAG: hypothetical protein EX272_00950 [Chromatiales bacterium]|nr:MAG: hypothetical protein EX272_00950 [Chromatiales bacterium]